MGFDHDMTNFFTNLKYAVRALRRQLSFSAIVVITLALGIGATTAIFSVTNVLLFTPLSYRDSDRLVALWQRAPESKVSLDWLSPGQYTEILEQSTSFESLALFYGGPIPLSLREPAEEVGFLAARASFFRVLDAKPQLGRLFTKDDDRGDAPTVAVLTHELWQRRYGGDPNIIGETVGLDSYPFEVVGILEPGFPLDGEVFPVGGGMSRYDIVLSMPRTKDRMADWENEGHNIIGKLRGGVSEEQAQAEMDVISRRLEELGLQRLSGASFYVDVVPLLDQVVGRVRGSLWALFGAAGLLLAIACLNVANLLLAHSTSRRRELAVFAMLGAGRARIIARFMTESLVLTAMGCALGVSLAWGCVRVLKHLGPVKLPRLVTLGVDERALAFALVLGLVASLVCGLLPASRTTLRSSWTT